MKIPLTLAILCIAATLLMGCSVGRNSDGSTNAQVQVTAADVVMAWQLYNNYKAQKIHADK
jgi:hypothetical protein